METTTTPVCELCEDRDATTSAAVALLVGRLGTAVDDPDKAHTVFTLHVCDVCAAVDNTSPETADGHVLTHLEGVVLSLAHDSAFGEDEEEAPPDLRIARAVERIADRLDTWATEDGGALDIDVRSVVVVEENK